MLLNLPARMHLESPRTFPAIGIQFDCEDTSPGAGIDHRQAYPLGESVVAEPDFRRCRCRFRESRQIALECTMEAVRSQYPQIVGAAVGAQVPGVLPALSGFQHVAAWYAIQVQAIIDMEYGGGAASVAEAQHDLVTALVGATANVQFVRQCARWPNPGSLHREHLRAFSRQRNLLQALLLGAYCVSLLARALRQRRQWLMVRIDEIECCQQIAADGATKRADVFFLHMEARFQETQHRSVVEHLRIDPAAAAPRRNHIHRHARAGAERMLVVGRRAQIIFAVGIDAGIAGQLVAFEAWRAWRRHMVEEAVVLVEVNQQHGLAPHVRIGSQRVQHFLRVPGALHRAGWARVFAIGGRNHDPGHLRQRAGADVLAQRSKEAAVGHGVGDALEQRIGAIVSRQVWRVRRAGIGDVAALLVGLAIGGEAGQRIVGEIVWHVLVNLPAHPGLLQPFRIGFPAIAGCCGRAIQLLLRVVDGRATVETLGVVGAGPVEHAVRIGAAVERAMVGVAHGEGIRQCELEIQFDLGVITHRLRLLIGRPGIHAAQVPGILGVIVEVVGAVDALRVAQFAIKVIRQDDARLAGGLVGIGLLHHVALVEQRNREAVAKAAHAMQGAEIMIEGAVFLHQDDHMFNVADGAGAVVGGNRQCPADGFRESCIGGCRISGGGKRGACGAQKVTAVFLDHDGPVVSL